MIKKYDFSGSPKEMGYQHGVSLKQEINKLYQRFIKDYVDFTPTSSERSILGVTGKYLDSTQKHAPDLMEEIEGIAEGANLEFEKIFFLNCYDEIAYYNETKEEANGCTLFLGTGRASADGRTYLGQGWDMEEFFTPIIMQTNPADKSRGPAAIMISHPGIVGGAGINEHGLSLVWSTVKATDEKTGVPCNLLIRKVLNCKDLSDALGVLLNTPRASGLNFIVGDRFGGFNYEATGCRERINYISTIYAHANHYECDSLRELAIRPPVRNAHTYLRSGRMRQLLENFFGRIDIESSKMLLCDHANYPNSICRHLVPGETKSMTQAALIFVPEEKLMLASQGPPCESGFNLYPLKTGK